MGRDNGSHGSHTTSCGGNVLTPRILEPLVTISNSFLGVLRWVDHFGSLVLTSSSVDGYEKYALSLVLKFGGIRCKSRNLIYFRTARQNSIFFAC
jgi:hypothetical protein